VAVALEIEDGNPWYLSRDLWVVPGNNPQGAPGAPIAGQANYLWALVRNTGRTPVQDATVRFYWANPAVGFDRTTANLVGTANVRLDAGQSEPVLCLAAWTPSFVNGGHVCILAEVFHQALDPLLPGPTFNVPTDRHVAQRNLSLVAAAKGAFRFAFEVHNPARVPRTFAIDVRQGELEQVKPLLRTLGPDVALPDRQGKISRIGLVRTPDPTPEAIEAAPMAIEKLELRPGERTGLCLVGQIDGGGALVHVLQRADDAIVGGLAVLLLPEGE